MWSETHSRCTRRTYPRPMHMEHRDTQRPRERDTERDIETQRNMEIHVYTQKREAQGQINTQ
eukprot:COSAG03_NODE_1060_length_4930_cov_9.328089_7_plen_62_part_00